MTQKFNPNYYYHVIQDNIYIYIAKHIQDTFSNANIYTIKWFANSLDLNPIKNIWSFFKSHISKHHLASHIKHKMTNAINKKWGKFSSGN